MGNSPEAGNNLLVLDIYKLCGETYTWILGKKKKKTQKKQDVILKFIEWSYSCLPY